MNRHRQARPELAARRGAYPASISSTEIATQGGSSLISPAVTTSVSIPASHPAAGSGSASAVTGYGGESTVVSGKCDLCPTSAAAFVRHTARIISTADARRCTQIDVDPSEAQRGRRGHDGVQAALICVHPRASAVEILAIACPNTGRKAVPPMSVPPLSRQGYVENLSKYQCVTGLSRKTIRHALTSPGTRAGHFTHPGYPSPHPRHRHHAKDNAARKTIPPLETPRS